MEKKILKMIIKILQQKATEQRLLESFHSSLLAVDTFWMPLLTVCIEYIVKPEDLDKFKNQVVLIIAEESYFPLIYVFNERLWKAHYAPSTMVDVGDTKTTKTILAFPELTIQ